MKMKKYLAWLVTLVMLLGLLAGCGASMNDSKSESMDSNNSGGASAPGDAGVGWDMDGEWKGESSSDSMADSVSPNAPEKPSNEKLIYTGNISIESTEFDESYTTLQSMVETAGGYFEQSNLSNYGRREGYFTVRIPAENFQSFYAAAGEQFHVVNKNYQAQNVSEAYYDLEARLSTQRTKLERLQELLKKAETMADIIEIESAISETELQIEYYTGSLRTYDAKIQYATLSINLYEVSKLSNTEEVQVGFGSRLVAAFQRGWSNFVNDLENSIIRAARNWVSNLIWLVILVVAFVFSRKSIRKRGGLKKILPKREKKAAAEQGAEPKE